MRIENEKIQLAPLNMNQVQIDGTIVGFEKKSILKLNPFQKEALQLIAQSLSIAEIADYYMQKKIIPSFQALHELILFMTSEKLITNPTFRAYFARPHADEQSLFEKIKERLFDNSDEFVDVKKELKKVPFLRSLHSELFNVLTRGATIVDTPSDIYVCRIGQTQRSMFVLLEGKASVYKTDPLGKNRRVAVLAEGSIFGEVGFFLDEPRTADVVTDEKSLIVKLPYDPEVFDTLIKKDIAREMKKRFWVIHALLKSEIFRNIPEDCFDALVFAGELTEYPQDTVIIREGDTGDSCHIVVQGSLVVSQQGKSIRVLGQGDCFGEMALIMRQGKRTASVKAQTDVLTLKIHYKKFYELLSHNLILAEQFEKIALSRIRSDRNRE